MRFGRVVRRRVTSRQEKLALDAQDLGDAPQFLIALAHAERFVDELQTLVDAAGEAQSFGILGEHPGMAQREAVLGQYGQGSSQQIQAGGDIALLDQQDPAKALAPVMPDRQAVLAPSG